MAAKPAELVILGAIEDELARLARDVAERTGCAVGSELLTDTSLAAGLAKAQILSALHAGWHEPRDRAQPGAARALLPAWWFSMLCTTRAGPCSCAMPPRQGAA